MKILTPVRDAESGTTTLTPLRRSIRHLPDTPKDAPNVCMVFPVNNLTSETKEETIDQPIPLTKEPTPPSSKKEPTPLSPKKDSDSNSEEITKPLRRSPRKTYLAKPKP